ncbi:hypothetical protein FACS189452_01560 [Bacteroidia bacterium]|nr:hypothetical protein FACS189452_01560 [Bacteroidia bacterium]
MKILFINAGQGPDYQCDVLFHGLKTLYGQDVYESADLWYMFNDITETEKHALGGYGFSLYGLLPCNLKNVLPSAVTTKLITLRHFDYIVYGSIWRCSDYFQSVARHYPKEKIIFVDGEDKPPLCKQFLHKGIYFKRELMHKKSNVFPICFGIPASKMVSSVGEKSKWQAHIIPGDKSTYIYDQEEPYYKDYAQSYFGITRKKGGWDCLRHYEILANGCLPYFIRLKRCPAATMCLFPKQLILQTNRLFKNKEQRTKNKELELLRLSEEALAYTRKHLSTESVATYMLHTAAQVKKVKPPFLFRLLRYARKVAASLWV